MTGQVKEEILTRFGELGLRVRDGSARFEPVLLRAQEFPDAPGEVTYADVGGHWQTLTRPAHAIAFTWCQVPVVYALSDTDDAAIEITGSDGNVRRTEGLALSREDTESIGARAGHILKLTVTVPRTLLHD